MSAVSMAAVGPRPVQRTARATGLPWTVEQFLRLLAVDALAFVALLIAWFGTSGTALPARGAGYVVVGIGGLIVLGLTNAMWLLAGRRAIGERRAEVLTGIEALLPNQLLVAPSTPEIKLEAPVAGVHDLFVAVPGATRFHLPNCQLALGKQVECATAEEHTASGRLPCGVCQS